MGFRRRLLCLDKHCHWQLPGAVPHLNGLNPYRNPCLAPARVILPACRLAVFIFVIALAGPVVAARIACVGDSITYGYGLSDPATQSYPAVLQGMLGPQHAVRNFGTGGCTILKQGDSPYWTDANFTHSTDFDPDIVVIMLGSNDAKPVNWQYQASFPADYLSLIVHYRDLGARVYVATPPPVFDGGNFGLTPGVVNDELVPLVRQVATNANAPLIDIFTAVSGLDSYFPDNIHPNAEGCALIAQSVSVALLPALRPPAIHLERLDPEHLSLSWTGADLSLQEAPSLTGPWVDCTNQAGAQVILPGGAKKFFRLR